MRSASGAWIDLRASLYVCGNSDQVGEIESALTEVVAEQGRMSGDEAAEYLSEMARDRRYQQSLN
jgi:sulfite reductase (NADPH) flavoprotein alpha-component